MRKEGNSQSQSLLGKLRWGDTGFGERRRRLVLYANMHQCIQQTPRRAPQDSSTPQPWQMGPRGFAKESLSKYFGRCTPACRLLQWASLSFSTACPARTSPAHSSAAGVTVATLLVVGAANTRHVSSGCRCFPRGAATCHAGSTQCRGPSAANVSSCEVQRAQDVLTQRCVGPLGENFTVWTNGSLIVLLPAPRVGLLGSGPREIGTFTRSAYLLQEEHVASRHWTRLG